MEGIALFTDAEMVAELKRRYPLGFIVAGIKTTDGVADGEVDRQTFFCDFQCLTTAIGLAHRTKALLTRVSITDLVYEEVDEDEEDEEA